MLRLIMEVSNVVAVVWRSRRRPSLSRLKRQTAGSVSAEDFILMHIAELIVKVINERNVGLDERPHHPTETNGQQPVLKSNPSAPDQESFDKTERIAVFEAKLAEADRRATSEKRRAEQYKKERDDAERRVRELEGALEQHLSSLNIWLEKVDQSEQELRAEKSTVEALLMKATVDTREEK